MADQIDDGAADAGAQEDPFGFEAASGASAVDDPAPVDQALGEPAADPAAAHLSKPPQSVTGSYAQEAYGHAAQRSRSRTEQYTSADGPLTPPSPPNETGPIE